MLPNPDDGTADGADTLPKAGVPVIEYEVVCDVANKAESGSINALS